MNSDSETPSLASPRSSGRFSLPGISAILRPSAIDPDTLAEIQHNRLLRVPVFCAITAAGWSFFGIFYLLRGAYHTASICFPEAIIMLGLFYHTLRKPESRRSLASAHIFVSFIGLGAEILISGLSDSTTLLFLSCLIVIAAHQSGFREAFMWTLICSAFVFAIHFFLVPSEWPVLRSSGLLDNATAFIGFYVLIMWMASHAEWYATKYFIRLTHNAKHLEYVAQHDQLTRLANRHRFQIELAEAEAWSLEQDRPFGLLALDLNAFKNINDSHGHMAGDIVLQEFAIRLNRAVENQHTVFRVGGDEFVIIVRDATRKLLRDIAKRIQQELLAPISVSGRRLPISTSVGATLFPEHAEETIELQSCADLALYAAKDSDGDLVFYAPKMTEQVVRKQSLIEQLSRAVEKQEFQLVYQPQISAENGRIFGVEALLRWHQSPGAEGPGVSHSPAEFIPVLESTGQINQVGKWVLETACKQLKAWLDQGIICCMSVNVSPVQFKADEFVPTLLEVIRKARVPTRCLDIEVTEGVMMDRLEETIGKLNVMRNAGIKISVDDFGTGYSSLKYLKHLPVDRLKIDQSFVRDIPQFDDGSIAKSILSLGHALDLTVIAEGVETRDQMELLADSGCDAFQGYFFAKPLSPEKCTELLCAQQSGTSPILPGFEHAEQTSAPSASMGESWC